MKILFTGATGVIGRLAVPLLISEGHEVDAVYRSDEDKPWLTEVGANAVKLDLFDADAVDQTVATADAIAHFATSIPKLGVMKKRKAWETNDRLRIDATRHLVDAGLRHSTQVFIQESITFVYADAADEWISESALVDPPWEVTVSALTAEAEVERINAASRRGIVLRMASLYGPGAASAEYVAAVAAHKMPVIGSGDNFISSLATVDAASAVVSALAAPAGIYNVADNKPVESQAALTALARRIGAQRPRHIPRWIARAAVGGAANLLTRSQRVSNRSFKKATGWEPSVASVVEGWDLVAEAVT